MSADVSDQDGWDLVNTVRELEARVATLEAALARVPGGADRVGAAVPTWGTPARSDARFVAIEESVTRLEDHLRLRLRIADEKPELGDYQTRVPATGDEVVQVCRQITSASWSPYSLVRLSGIDWRVLDVVHDDSGHRALLLSDRVISRAPYHRKTADITWEFCDVRRWLNNVFGPLLGAPLTSRVLASQLPNEPGLFWDAPGGNDTTDRFFLLSIKEAIEYLGTDSYIVWEKIRNRGYYALGERGITTTEDGQTVWWWLRSPGRYPDRAAAVFTTGSIPGYGHACAEAGGVRPAFWLNLL